MSLVLSTEQENDLIERNMKKICRAVDNFVARCPYPVVRVSYDDFVQEVSIAFLQYVRRCKTMEDTEIFPWYDATQAMSRLVLSSQPMSCPERSGSFRKIVGAMPHTVSYETNPESVVSVDGMSRNWVDDKDTLMDLEMFVDSLPVGADRVISMRIWGLSDRKIASQMGVTPQAISKQLIKYHKQYKEFTEEDKEYD